MAAPALTVADGETLDAAIVWPMQHLRQPEKQESHSLWAARPLASRLAILEDARHRLSHLTSELCSAISPELARTPADTLVAEVLPLLAACQFLEREAPATLALRRLGRKGLPFWLSGVDATVERVPLGRILVIAPSNYPLLLPGVQVLQALAAGNSVTWKPGLSGAAVANLMTNALYAAGLPRELLHVTDESVEAAQRELQAGVDKVIFTGSFDAGREVLRRCAESLTPCVIETSGCDAAMVLPSADIHRVVKALAFGMRLNGSATCMAPRRILLLDPDGTKEQILLEHLRTALDWVRPVPVNKVTRTRLSTLLQEAAQAGAEVLGECEEDRVAPILVLRATPEMRIAQADIFAPVLVVIGCKSEADLLAAQAACPFALSASIFGEEREARSLAEKLEVGTVTINDMIVPTADPRVPFGGRRNSGFGVTRGREGLLEMTAAKVISVRSGRSTRQYDPTGSLHEDLFAAVVRTTHAGTFRTRWLGLRSLIRTALKMR